MEKTCENCKWSTIIDDPSDYRGTQTICHNVEGKDWGENVWGTEVFHPCERWEGEPDE